MTDRQSGSGVRPFAPGPLATFGSLTVALTGACVGNVDPRTDDPRAQAKMIPGAELAAARSFSRLSSNEYDSTVRDLLGEAKAGSGLLLPPDERAPKSPFDNEYRLQVPGKA